MDSLFGEYYRIGELAQVLGVRPATIRSWLRQWERFRIPHTYFGPVLLFPKRALQRYLEKRVVMPRLLEGRPLRRYCPRPKRSEPQCPRQPSPRTTVG